MDELRLNLREISRNLPRGEVKFPDLEGDRWVVLQGIECSLRFHFDGKDCDDIHFIHEDPDYEFVEEWQRKDSAFVRLEPTDEAFREMILEMRRDRGIPLASDDHEDWSVLIGDNRAKWDEQGDYNSEIEGENTKLEFWYDSASFYVIEYTITNPKFGKISEDSFISENEVRVIVRKPVEPS